MHRIVGLVEGLTLQKPFIVSVKNILFMKYVFATHHPSGTEKICECNTLRVCQPTSWRSIPNSQLSWEEYQVLSPIHPLYLLPPTSLSVTSFPKIPTLYPSSRPQANVRPPTLLPFYFSILLLFLPFYPPAFLFFLFSHSFIFLFSYPSTPLPSCPSTLLPSHPPFFPHTLHPLTLLPFYPPTLPPPLLIYPPPSPPLFVIFSPIHQRSNVANMRNKPHPLK